MILRKGHPHDAEHGFVHVVVLKMEGYRSVVVTDVSDTGVGLQAAGMHGAFR